MKVQHLAEAVILQAMEDLWDEEHREDCIGFFTGEDFRACAALAGVDTAEQIKILNLMEKVMESIKTPARTVKRASRKHLVPRRLAEMVRA